MLSNFIGFSGRLNRQPFWVAGIVLFVVGLIIGGGVQLIAFQSMPPMPAVDANTTAADLAAYGQQVAASIGWTRWVSWGLFVVLLYPSAAICIKRRHDRGSSGIDVWIYFALIVVLQIVYGLGIGASTMEIQGIEVPVPGPVVTVVGLIVGVLGLYLLVVLCFLKGTTGPNKYGPDPLQG